MVNNKKIEKTIKNKYLFGMLAGSLYIIIGILQILTSFGDFLIIEIYLLIPNDIIGGFILIVIGSVYSFGVYEVRKGIFEGVAYFYVGIILSIFFMMIYSLILLVNYIQANLFQLEEFSNWTPLDDLKPGIYLGILAIIGFILWRENMSIKKISG